MILRNLIRFAIGAVFLISALLKMAEFDATSELFSTVLLTEIMTSKILLGILIMIEFIVAYVLIADYLKYNIVSVVIRSIIIFFIAVCIVLLLKGYSNCGCFGTSISSSPLISLLKNTILLSGLYYLRIKKKY